MTAYMIWITSPPSRPNHFTIHIAPRRGWGTIVRQSHFEDESVLRQVLLNCLSTNIIVDDVIVGARENGIADLRGKAISLSDKCAQTMGWIR
jgi:hypothetical protein